MFIHCCWVDFFFSAQILKKFVLNRDAASIQVAIESECQMDVLNHLDSDRFSLLYLSAKNNFVAVAKVLLRANADANLRCASQFTALTIAALNGHDQMVKLLLELPEIAIDERDRFQRAALDNAAMMGHAGIAQQLLDANADVVAEQCLPTGGAPVDAPRTALFYAAGNGHTAIVEQLLNANASLDHSLAFAASCGRCETIAFLLQRNADIHQVDASGGSCLHTAAQAAQNDAIALLLQAGAEIDLGDKRGGTPLMRAVCKDRLATVELLLAAGANVNHRNAKQQTPLHEALARGLADIVEQLLKAGADPNAACVHGFTCLHYAVRHQWDTNVVASLLTAKADLDVAASNDMTPLTYAVFCGRASVVKHLLASGARVQNKAMQLARKANSAEIRELFACALCGWGGMCCGECRTNHCQRKCQKLLLGMEEPGSPCK